MARVFVTRRLAGDALERLRSHADVDVWEGEMPPTRDELLARVGEVEGLLTLLTERVDGELLDAAPKLRVVSNYAVGFDNIDVEACAARGVVVGTTGDVLTDATADLAMALLLAAARHLPAARDAARAGRWRTWEPEGWLGLELRGARLVIVGAGRIGRAVAQRAHAFGMEVELLGRDGDLRAALARADVVSLHAPLTPETRHLIDARTFAIMRPGTILVNTARGGLIDQAALLDATHVMAAIDVTDPEPPPPGDAIVNAAHVLVVPHIGSATRAARERMTAVAVDNLLAGLAGDPLPPPRRLMRIAVVDIGSNSTRLLVADVADGAVTQLERRTSVTRLADGVDTTGRLSDEAIARVDHTLADYRKAIEDLQAELTIGVLTSAVRDAANGEEFVTRVREVYGIDARVIPGDEEARLTFLGATAGRDDIDHVAVVDIGGGSTEIITGAGFRTSLQMGVVRFTERHLHHDPPEPAELQRLTGGVREVLAAVLPANTQVQTLIAVAGTATTAAAIAHDVEPYDPDRVHGAHITAGDLEEMLARLAMLPNAERREVRGLHPDRAPTIVAGITILLEVTRAFGLDELEISEHDILLGAALETARGRAGTG